MDIITAGYILFMLFSGYAASDAVEHTIKNQCPAYEVVYDPDQ